MLTKEKFLEEIVECRSVYSFVAMARKQLIEHGFQELNEKEKWGKIPKKFFVVRNESAIFAGKIGTLDCAIFTGSHIDYPCFKVNLDTSETAEKIEKLKVTEYGYTKSSVWFDRDLAICGLVNYKKDGKTLQKVIRINKAIATIPSISPEYKIPTVSKKPLVNEMSPIIGFNDTKESTKKFIGIIAKEVGCETDDIIDFDLSFYDANPPETFDDYVFAQGLDDLSCALTCLSGFLNAKEPEKGSQFATFLNNEEIGSMTPTGARGNFIPSILERLGVTFKSNLGFFRKSMFISADVTYGASPNYPDCIAETSPIILGEGPCYTWSNCNYMATSFHLISCVKRICDCDEEKKLKINHSVQRITQNCGSTIGPIIATKLSMDTLDIGIPVSSMHSIREMSHFNDIFGFEKFVKLAYEHELEYRLKAGF